MTLWKRLVLYTGLCLIVPVVYMATGESLLAPFYYSRAAVVSSTPVGYGGDPDHIRLSPTGDGALRETGDGKVAVLRTDERNLPQAAALPLWSNEKFAWDDSGRRVLTYGFYRVRVHDLETHEVRRLYLAALPEWTPEGRIPHFVSDLALSTDGRFLAVTASDHDWTHGVGVFERLDQPPQNGGPAAPANPAEEDPIHAGDPESTDALHASKVSDYRFLGWVAGGEQGAPRLRFSRDGTVLFVVSATTATAVALPTLEPRVTHRFSAPIVLAQFAPFAVHPDAPLLSLLVDNTLVQLDPLKREVRQRPFAHDRLVQLVVQPGGRPWARREYGDLITYARSGSDELTRYDFKAEPGYRNGVSEGGNLRITAEQTDGSRLRMITAGSDYTRNHVDTLDLAVAETQLLSGFDHAHVTGFFWLLGLLPGGILAFEGIRGWSRWKKRSAAQQRARLFDGCVRGDLPAVRTAAAGRTGLALLAETNDRGFTPLLIAAGMGHNAVGLHLLDRGAAAAVVGPDGATPLHLACCRTETQDLAIRLLESGADPSRPNKNGLRPARLAAEGGFLRVVEAFARQAPTAFAVADADGVTPACGAAINNHAEVFAVCAAAAPESLQAKRKSDDSHAAYAAAFHGNLPMLELVARHAPAMLSTAGTNGYLPATVAALKGHAACVRFLAGLVPATLREIMVADGGVTAANLAAQNNHPEVLEVLAEFAPATLGHARPADGATPAFVAAFKGHARCLDAIGRAAPSALGLPNKEGHTPAFVAAQEGHLECLQTIARHLPDTLAGEPGGLVAISAAQSGQTEVIQFLMTTAPHLFVAQHKGCNALHAAAAAGEEATYRLIAESQPTLLTIPDSDGVLPDKLLEAAKARREAPAKSGTKDENRAETGMGVVLWGIGFRPDSDMLRTAILLKAQQNFIASMLLIGLPSEIGVFDEMPSEIEACMAFSRIAARRGWKDVTPKFQTLGLKDGRKLILAYPPIL